MRRGARDSRAQSAAGSVPSLTPQRRWSHGGTSGSHNGNYLQPQWGNEAKMSLWRQRRSRERAREERESERGETSEWPLLPCDCVSEPLEEPKPSKLISSQRDFLRARRGNSLCHKSWKQTWGRSEFGSSLGRGHRDAAGKWTQSFTFCSEPAWEGRWWYDSKLPAISDVVSGFWMMQSSDSTHVGQLGYE